MVFIDKQVKKDNFKEIDTRIMQKILADSSIIPDNKTVDKPKTYNVVGTGVIVVDDSSMYGIAKEGIRINDMIRKFSMELSEISRLLKEYGVEVIEKWNSAGEEEIKSIRVFSGDIGTKTVLISTRKTAYDLGLINDELKLKLGSGEYKGIFEETNTWSIKPGMSDSLFSLLKSSFGATFIKKFFNCSTTVSIKSGKKFAELIENDRVGPVLKKAECQKQVSITYPK